MKSELKRLMDEGLTFQSSELEKISWNISDNMPRKKLRTAEEIKISSETIPPFRTIWQEKRIKGNKLSESIKNKSEKIKYQKLEEEYIRTLKKLVKIQRKLIGRFEEMGLTEFDLVDIDKPGLRLKQKK